MNARLAARKTQNTGAQENIRRILLASPPLTSCGNEKASEKLVECLPTEAVRIIASHLEGIGPSVDLSPSEAIALRAEILDSLVCMTFAHGFIAFPKILVVLGDIADYETTAGNHRVATELRGLAATIESASMEKITWFPRD
ncbi:hypothetical protein L0Y65_06015 [Candidatus Micrarchaeota archaeon]|nr:hypothetical protein [Candidatus Micrarchaeota archaeon]